MYEAIIIGTSNMNMLQLVTIIKHWLQNKPLLVINSTPIQVESVCHIVRHQEQCIPDNQWTDQVTDIH